MQAALGMQTGSATCVAALAAFLHVDCVLDQSKVNSDKHSNLLGPNFGI